MSWSDVFSIFSERLPDGEVEGVLPLRVISHKNRGSSGPIVAVALSLNSIEVIDSRYVKTHDEISLNDVAERLVHAAKLLRDKAPGAILRIYMSNRYFHLESKFTNSGCEVVVMGDQGSEYFLSTFWPFLALEDGDRYVTILDIQRCLDIGQYVERTYNVGVGVAGGWRTPCLGIGVLPDRSDPSSYWPIDPGMFGVAKNYPVRYLLSCFFQELKVALNGSHPNDGYFHFELSGKFLREYVYPRVAADGIITYLPWDWKAVHQHVTIDIEYVTWSSDLSGIEMYYDPSVSDKVATEVFMSANFPRKNLRSKRRVLKGRKVIYSRVFRSISTEKARGGLRPKSRRFMLR